MGMSANNTPTPRRADEFVETIRVVDGEPQALDAHQERMNRTLAQFAPGVVGRLRIDAGKIICGAGVWKARVVYSPSLESVRYEAAPYQMKMIRTLRLVSCDDIDYSFKSTDRSALNALHEMRGDADDVIIVKNGELTDTSYANLALWDGSRWLTPERPLLCGTMRSRLIECGVLSTARLTPGDIAPETPIAIFNAMIPFGDIVAHLVRK